MYLPMSSSFMNVKNLYQTIILVFESTFMDEILNSLLTDQSKLYL